MDQNVSGLRAWSGVLPWIVSYDLSPCILKGLLRRGARLPMSETMWYLRVMNTPLMRSISTNAQKEKLRLRYRLIKD